MKNKKINTLSIALILHWLSLFFSYQKLPNAYKNIHEPIATGGFPFKAFKYPSSSMGSDWPPLEMLPLFFANFAIWFLIAYIIVSKFGSRITKRVNRILSSSAIYLTIAGIFYIMLKFD